ncbi:MAG: hypothetical protein HFJ33_07690 [Clostridia bacterium]|nr:hypothetical protein [Clostridia bacterium]
MNPYWGTLEATAQFIPSEVSNIQFGGWGYDHDYGQSEAFLNSLVVQLKK